MAKLTRRSLLRNCFGLVAAGTLARPYIANAATATAALWWTQGSAEEEEKRSRSCLADHKNRPAAADSRKASLAPQPLGKFTV